MNKDNIDRNIITEMDNLNAPPLVIRRVSINNKTHIPYNNMAFASSRDGLASK